MLHLPFRVKSGRPASDKAPLLPLRGLGFGPANWRTGDARLFAPPRALSGLPHRPAVRCSSVARLGRLAGLASGCCVEEWDGNGRITAVEPCLRA